MMYACYDSFLIFLARITSQMLLFASLVDFVAELDPDDMPWPDTDAQNSSSRATPRVNPTVGVYTAD